jgi:uncharacterized protein (DUF1015 family)
MAEFRPFSGVRYDQSLAGELKDVVAPPYDVMNADDVATLHARSRFNVTHLTRPSGTDPYAEASRIFSDWKSQGILKEDVAPAFYIYRQTFVDPDTGETFPERVGIVGLLKVEEYATGKVLPHENTLTAARADRLGLLRQTLANFESIYGLYSDEAGVIADVLKAPSEFRTVIGHVDDAIGSSHTLEALIDEHAIEVISQHLLDAPIFIADGHHRYETSLGFSKERLDLPGAQYILITLTAFEDEGLLVLPTHRLLRNFDPGEIDILPARLIEKGFTVTLNSEQVSHLRPHQYVLITSDREYLVSLESTAETTKLVPNGQSEAWKSLDVSILHTLIVGDILGVPLDTLSTTDRISYTRDAVEAREKVADGTAQAALIMGRPTVAQMKAVSEAGDKMPQKSTFFYPKLLSGLLLYDLSN